MYWLFTDRRREKLFADKGLVMNYGQLTPTPGQIAYGTLGVLAIGFRGSLWLIDGAPMINNLSPFRLKPRRLKACEKR